jgi:shikimate kinase
MNNVILCGFMGCGKSTIGKNAAKKTGRRFVDMDEYIEKQAGKTVAEIFAERGEEGFRELEHEACIELSKNRNLIVATGGGALTFERNVEVFRGTDTIVLLDVPLRVIRLRLRYDKKRPLLQRPDRDKVITELYNSRMPKYLAAADVVVKGESTPMKTTNSLIAALNLKK